MLIEIDTETLVENNLTASQYLLIYLVYKKQLGTLTEYIEANGITDDELTDLVDKQIIHNANSEGEYDWSKIVVRERFAEQIFGDFSVMWDEFWDTYPSNVIRVEGNKSALKGSNKKMKEKYRKIVGNDIKKHQHVLRLLKFELNYRKLEDSMKWMKTLSRWLNDESWLEYEEIYNESQTKKKVGYGESVE